MFENDRKCLIPKKICICSLLYIWILAPKLTILKTTSLEILQNETFFSYFQTLWMSTKLVHQKKNIPTNICECWEFAWREIFAQVLLLWFLGKSLQILGGFYVFFCIDLEGNIPWRHVSVSKAFESLNTDLVIIPGVTILLFLAAS